MDNEEREIDVRISGKNWNPDVEKAEMLVRDVLDALEARLGPLHAGVLEVWFATDNDLQALNHTFRSKNMPTNVLSFSPPTDLQSGFGQCLGQLALADGVCVQEANARSVTLEDHACHLVLHGLLHLEGYDHETDADAKTMETIECAVMKALDLHDPYSVRGEAHV